MVIDIIALILVLIITGTVSMTTIIDYVKLINKTKTETVTLIIVLIILVFLNCYSMIKLSQYV